MTKKTLGKIIAIILVVSMFTALFAGCKPKLKEVEFESLYEKIVDGMEKKVGDNLLDDLSIASKLAVVAEAGGKSTTYDIDFALQLDLAKNSTTRNNGLKFVVKEGQETLFGAWYVDNDEQRLNNELHIQYKGLLDSETYKIAANVPDVRSTLNDKKEGVDGEWVKGEIDNADIAGLLGAIAIAATEPKANNKKVEKATEVSFKIPLTALLSEGDLAETVGSLQPTVEQYFKALGIYLNLSTVGQILPNISAEIKVNFDKKTGAVTTMNIALSVDKKDMSIDKADPMEFEDYKAGKEWKSNGKKLLTLNLANNVKLNATMNNLDVGKATIAKSQFNAPFDYSQTDVNYVSLLNFKVGGEIKVLDNDIKISLAGVDIDPTLAGIVGGLQGINKGTYALDIQADIDATKLVNADFNFASTPYFLTDKNGDDVKTNRTYLKQNKDGEVTLEGMDGTVYTTDYIDGQGGVKWFLSPTGKKNVDDLVKTVINAINYLKIELDGGAGNKQIIEVTKGKLTAFNFMGISLQGMSLDNIVSIVMNLVAPADKISSAEPNFTSTADVFGKGRTVSTAPTQTEEEKAEAAKKAEKDAYNQIFYIGRLIDALSISVSDSTGLGVKLDPYAIKDGEGADIGTVEIPSLKLDKDGLFIDVKFALASGYSYLEAPVHLNITINQFVLGGAYNGGVYTK